MSHGQTDELIRMTAKRLFASYGYDGLSMRTLAEESGVGLSSIYHFFKDKDVLLETIYSETNRFLGIERSRLPAQPTAEKMLVQVIDFQIKHIEDVVYVLKYYMHFRKRFAQLPSKTFPPKATLHIEEVLIKGIDTGELKVESDDIKSKAKVITHTINGYLLEYYPDKPKGRDRQEMIRNIVEFSMASLSPVLR